MLGSMICKLHSSIKMYAPDDEVVDAARSALKRPRLPEQALRRNIGPQHLASPIVRREYALAPVLSCITKKESAKASWERQIAFRPGKSASKRGPGEHYIWGARQINKRPLCAGRILTTDLAPLQFESTHQIVGRLEDTR